MVDIAPPRTATIMLLQLIDTQQRFDLINHIVETWERDQLTTTITEDLVITYEGDNHGLATFIERSIGDEEEVREVLIEIGILDS